MENKSIYYQIIAMLEENPGLPYFFQNVELAGKWDINFSLWSEGIPTKKKIRYSIELIDVLESCMRKGKVCRELREWLGNNPMTFYFDKLGKRLQLLLSEGYIDGELLYPLGLELATEGEYAEEVKLGILILGQFENDLTRQIIKTLGMHSEFTLYALDASNNFKDHNSFVFELAKGTRGYGKVASLAMLTPITLEQKKWIFSEGAINEVVPNISSIISLEKEDMISYYKNHEITEESFQSFSYVLAYAGETNDLKELSLGFEIIQKYVDVAMEFAVSFIDLASIVVIENNVEPEWKYNDSYGEWDDRWTREVNERIREICFNILKKPKWKHVALSELDNPTESTGLILKVINRLNMIPGFGEIVPLLNRDIFDLSIMEFTLIQHPEFYIGVIYEYLKMVLPDDVFSQEPLAVSTSSITTEFKPDIWLVYLLKALIDEEQNERDLFMKCLQSRFPDVRVEAIRAFQVLGGYYRKDVQKVLVEAIKKEPVKDIRKQLYQLLDRRRKNTKKERQYLDVDHVKIEYSPLDIKLMDTVIAGTLYRDMMVVKGELEKGDILYLIREADNKYDEKAILVVAPNGYVLGYVPKEDNPRLAEMLDAGEKLYAVLGSHNIGKVNPSIGIMLNKPYEDVSNIIPFPGS